MTLHLAGALRARGLRIAILDADFNGPSQARMAGVQGALFVPGSHKVALPRTRNGIGVFSMGSVIPESEALEFESAAHGESHTWRATREFALLGEILGSFEWGALNLLMFDLPPGAERTVQYADFLGPRTSFLLVTIPSEVARGVVARSVAALSKGPNRLLGYVENMSGYYCRDCNAIKPLFGSPEPFDATQGGSSDLESPASGPFRSIRSLHDTAIWGSPSNCPTPLWAGPWIRSRSDCWTASKQRSSPMKFLCVPCDSPMKLQTVAPPERGSLSIVYSCPECGYEMAMLTNAYETQVVQSLGVRIGPESGAREVEPAPAPGARSRDDSGDGRGSSRRTESNPSGGLPPPKRGSRTFLSSSAPWRGPASRDSPERGGPWKWTRRSSTRPATSSACEARHRDEHAPS